jgi:hypothetical protein
MYGGFSFRLESASVEAKLICESWCAVVGGSGKRHEITAEGSCLVAKGVPLRANRRHSRL